MHLAQLDPVAVWVDKKCLVYTVRTCSPRKPAGSHEVEMCIPLIEIVHCKRNVVSTMMGVYRMLSIADQVQFLRYPQPKPCARKIKIWPQKCLKPQGLRVKPYTCVDIRHVQSNMVQFKNVHRNWVFGLPHGRSAARFRFRTPSIVDGHPLSLLGCCGPTGRSMTA